MQVWIVDRALTLGLEITRFKSGNAVCQLSLVNLSATISLSVQWCYYNEMRESFLSFENLIR